MKKAFLSCFLFLVLLIYAFPVLAEDLTLKTGQQKGEWVVLNQKGDPVGTLKNVDRDAFLVTLGGRYIGTILKSGDLQTNRNHAIFKPEDAQFYLDVLKALRAIGKI